MQLARSPPMRPAPLYYLENFRVLLETLRHRDAGLLAAEESAFLEEFDRLPSPAQALVVRMVMRKGSLFRRRSLHYAEIAVSAEVDAALRLLCTRGLLEPDPPLALEDIFRLFAKGELVQLLGLPAGALAERKAALLERLRAEYPGTRRLCAWGAVPVDAVYRLTVDDLCTRLVAMFFGNQHQALSEFVLVDLGIVKYEPACLQGSSRPFHSRAQVDAFHRLAECRARLEADEDPASVERELPPPLENCDWLEVRRQKIRFLIARAYERRGAPAAAAVIYAGCSHRDAAVRARILEHATRRIRRKPAAPVPSFELELPPAPGVCVEMAVADHLSRRAAEPTHVHYVENTLVTALFGLLCWQAVFAPVRGAFFHPFHRAPADLADAGFFERRGAQFEECFAQLDSDGYKDAILARFAASHGVLSPFVAWGALDEPLLRTALEHFPPRHLRILFEWMGRDPAARRRGFPDLVQFFPDGRRYHWIEVKAPGDRLQASQRACLQLMLEHGMPVSVCRVRWAAGAQRAQRGS